MALRLCSGYESLQLINPMFSAFDGTEPCLVEDVSNVWVNDRYGLNPFYSINDPSSPFFLDPGGDCLYQENGTYSSPYLADLSCFGSPVNFPAEDRALGCYYDELPHAKRRRTVYECLPADPTTLVNYGDHYLDPLGNQLLVPELSRLAFPNPRPQISAMQNMEGETVALSPQSVAARQRRKKISEKTHELGRLIPGGTKMNTAEMLASAAKYVKFLQAQVRVLEVLNNSTPHSGKQDKEDFSTNLQLHHLLSSLTMQEKLYEAEKCVLPIKSAKILETSTESTIF